jgi:Protein of unknown function (DUF2384)
MTTLAERVTDLGRRLQYAAEDDAVTIEAAVVAAAAVATRRRPTALPPAVRTHPPERVAAARARTLEAFLEARSALLADSLSTIEVARRLGVSAAAVTKRRVAGRLVAFRHRGDWRYPAWQLADGAVLPGIADAWREMPHHAEDLRAVRWFTLPSRHLGGRAPIDVLRDGDPAAVVDAASYVGSR